MEVGDILKDTCVNVHGLCGAISHASRRIQNGF